MQCLYRDHLASRCLAPLQAPVRALIQAGYVSTRQAAI